LNSLATLGLGLGSAWLSGFNLYATVLTLGLLQRFHLVQLPGDLDFVSRGWVIGVAAVLYLVEFLADKIPVVDSLWDAVHTVIRPIGGALVASRALGELSPVAEVLALLLLGGATLATHAAKATTRLAVNTSPEPVSNILVSLTENGLLVGAVWLALAHPLVALGAGVVAVAVSILLTVWLAHRAIGVLRRARPGRTAGPPRNVAGVA
jgi:Domain of unknown function (DUF4126)